MQRFLSLVMVLCAAGTAAAEDWYQWRGPEENGVSREKNLPDKWSAAGENLVWKQPYGGRTVPIVMNGRVYVINDSGEGISEQERVMCFDANTGDVQWEHKFNVWLTGIVSERVGWSNVVGDPETGNVYAHGVQGMLICFDGKDGKVKWQHSLTEEYGRITGYGGRVTSPIIDGDLLIMGLINSSWGELARGGNRFVAFDKKTGEVVWWSETGHPVKNTYYSNPVVAVINGERVLVSGGGDGGVHAFQVRTGKKLWSYLFGTGDVNVTPVVGGNYVYIGQGAENLTGGERGTLLCLDASKVKNGKPELVWKVEGIQFTFPTPILRDDKLYIADEAATLYCYDVKQSIQKKEGVELWEQGYGKEAKGSPVWADGKIYATSVEGNVVILQPGDKECKELSKVRMRSQHPGIAIAINGGPSVANGRVYFMTSEEIYCIGKKGATPQSDPIPAGPKEEPPAAGAKAAQLQVVPADVELYPGQSATFKVRLFDAQGRFLREAKAEWETGPMLPPPPVPGAKPQEGPAPPKLQGEITADGKLTVSDKVPGQFGGVIAKAEGLTGRARVRVAPRLPYTQDFTKVPENRTPAGWVGAQGKFLVKKLGDKNVLAKNNTVPSTLVAKANTYITIPDAGHGDYTIQADVRGSLKNKQYLPDMGLINCRYTLILTGIGQVGGVGQTLALQSWDAIPRIDKSVNFPWKPDTWYTLKLSVEQSGGKAVLKGKVWERGKDEPKDWTVTFEDPTPNGPGSPGLHGFSTDVVGPANPGSEIYYDNVKVTPNKAEAPAKKGGAPGGARGAARPAAEPVVFVQSACVPAPVVCVPAPVCERRLFGRWRH
ncbi:MAG TPA: PQQ-binding-like beta-propeller repeat protein [Gemmataceae bacterium]|nr:PQQ-binding-like beta-propeller repeat protein [Gemmataceae bacterium]